MGGEVHLAEREPGRGSRERVPVGIVFVVLWFQIQKVISRTNVGELTLYFYWKDYGCRLYVQFFNPF